MARIEFTSSEKAFSGLERLADRIQRGKCIDIMLTNGAKVLEKEWRGAIDRHKHIATGDMRESVGIGELVRDIDGSYVTVYPTGYDRRGISNATKAHVINSGSGHTWTKRSHGKSINKNTKGFAKEISKKCAPRIGAVMSATLDHFLSENGGK